MADPLCLLSMLLYAANRWLVKPWSASAFLHGHFNDLLLIPAALPWMLWIHRRLGWRSGDHVPAFREIALHTAVWSAICEGLGPRLLHHGTSDPWDVAAYAAGGLLAWLAWRFTRAPAGVPGLDGSARPSWRLRQRSP